MVRFFKLVALAIVAVVILVLAFANRHVVTVSFDPFASGDNSAFSIAAPLFAVVIASAMLGVVAGRSRLGCRKAVIGGPRARTGSRRTKGASKPRR